jgi:macrolide transport system ATP-binding/permease protein
VETLLQDIRYSFRTMVRNPGFVAAAVISLALGIGPNTIIFSLVNALLLRPLPVDQPDRLARVFRVDEHSPYHSLSYPDYLDYRDRQQTFTGLTACQRIMMSLSIDGQPTAVLGAVVSANFFPLLGVQASLGRTFTPEEDQGAGRNPVAVISYNLWQRRFSADPAMLGKTLRLNGQSFTIIGVAAKGFTGVDTVIVTEVWVPITMYPALIPNQARAFDPVAGRHEAWLNDVIGRLKPGVSIEQAQSDLSGISAQLERDYPSRQTNRRRGIALALVSQGHPEMRNAVVSFSALLMAVVGLAWLVACANVANLLLTRAAARRKEIAIRLAVGASHWRLLRQLLTESTVLALAGGVLGILLAFWASNLLLLFKPSVSIPVSIDLNLDHRVLIFSLAISILTGIVFGLAPSLQSSRPDLVPALKAEQAALRSRSRESRLHSLFVIAQLALSLVLLIGAGLLRKSMQNAYHADPGFEKNNLALLSTDLDLRGYTSTTGAQFYLQLMNRLQTLPGLQSVSIASLFPLSFASSETAIAIEGRASQSGSPETLVGSTSVAPRYFETMNIPLIQGREFDNHDIETGPRVAIINQTMASHFWPGEGALGKRIKVNPLAPESLSYTVIGVVKDSKFGTLGESPRPFLYMSIFQEYSPGITLVARTRSNPAGMLNAIRQEVRSLDPDLLIYDVKTITEHLDVTLFPLKMAAVVLGLLGALALILASVGLYAVIAYSVTLRTREFGIRLALGAGSAQIMKMVLKRGMVLSLIGIAIGLLLALVMARTMLSLGLLLGIGAADPATFSGVLGLLILVALLASYFPARRAMKIDPVIALRQG